MAEEAPVTKHLDKIILAGAFGSHIDKTKAMMTGMVPDCPLDEGPDPLVDKLRQ